MHQHGQRSQCNELSFASGLKYAGKVAQRFHFLRVLVSKGLLCHHEGWLGARCQGECLRFKLASINLSTRLRPHLPSCATQPPVVVAGWWANDGFVATRVLKGKGRNMSQEESSLCGHAQSWGHGLKDLVLAKNLAVSLGQASGSFKFMCIVVTSGPGLHYLR